MKRMILLVGSLLASFPTCGLAESDRVYDPNLQLTLTSYDGKTVVIRGPGNPI